MDRTGQVQKMHTTDSSMIKPIPYRVKTRSSSGINISEQFWYKMNLYLHGLKGIITSTLLAPDQIICFNYCG